VAGQARHRQACIGRISLRMNRSGSDVQILQMYSQGVRLPSVLSERTSGRTWLSGHRPRQHPAGRLRQPTLRTGAFHGPNGPSRRGADPGDGLVPSYPPRGQVPQFDPACRVHGHPLRRPAAQGPAGSFRTVIGTDLRPAGGRGPARPSAPGLREGGSGGAVSRFPPAAWAVAPGGRGGGHRP